MLPWVCPQCLIVIFPGHTHSLFSIHKRLLNINFNAEFLNIEIKHFVFSLCIKDCRVLKQVFCSDSRILCNNCSYNNYNNRMTANVQPHFKSEMVTIYSPMLLANFDEYFINLCSGIDQI